MDNFTLHPMSDFMLDSVTMDYNLVTNNMIDHSMVNNLVVDNSTNNDLMAITKMAKGLIIHDSGADDLMVDDSTRNSVTVNDSMAYTRSPIPFPIGSPATNTPVASTTAPTAPPAPSPNVVPGSLLLTPSQQIVDILYAAAGPMPLGTTGDSIDTPMIDSPMGNGSTTNIFPAGNPPGKDLLGSAAYPAMTQSLTTTGTMVGTSLATKKATSIFTPRLRKSLGDQMLFVNGPRKTEGVWLCLQCIRHLDRDDDEEARKWHTRYGISRGLELHPEARTKKLNCTHCKERRRCNFVKRSG
ncbi:hypothetical protein CEP54_008246 [Fusarium duplospermum]|uniref:Uncharacterized protein n=1 Tax=Fusarium duplospermum TaxID=1325734 RepID=A0A428PWY4_9HYPO|nr:hypothetical protein CEP54_008246 [Fusarium duplospermum]